MNECCNDQHRAGQKTPETVPEHHAFALSSSQHFAHNPDWNAWLLLIL